MNNTTDPLHLKVIVADDHPVFRSGVEGALKRMKFISKISSAANGVEVIKLLERCQYDLVLMDIQMNPMDGIDTTKLIQKKFPTTKVIALSMYEDERRVVGMLEQGAAGYLLKNADSEEIELAIKEVMRGGQYFSKEVSGVLVKHLNQMKEVSDETPFHKERIREIIFLISHEFTSAEIGDAISISERTVDDYRKDILKMTNSRNSAGIAKYAVSQIDKDVLLLKKFRKILDRST